MWFTVLQFALLLFAGLLAGEEFVVRWGVQPSLRRLSDPAHLEARQALVRRLRIVVPAIMLPTAALGVVFAIVASGESGAAFGWIGLAFTAAFLLFSFAGTVPINIQVNDWDLANPPADWRAVVTRWERIDVFRSSAALLAFASYLLAVLL